MNSVAPVFGGALLTSLVSVAMGLVLVRLLRLPVHRREARLIGFLLGSAALSLVVFLLGALWLLRTWVFSLVGAGAIAACLATGAWRYGSSGGLQRLPARWRWMFGLALAVFGVYSLAHAAAPEISPDGSAYHLGTVARYLRDGGFAWYTANMYANLPMGVEMLYLYAFAYGKHSAAALVHWQFYLSVPLLLASFGSRFGFAKAGAVAGALVFLSPVVSIDGSSAYVDVATAAVAFGLLYLLLLWECGRARGYLVAIGVLAGFAYASKMTLWPAAPFAALFVAWVSWRSGGRWLRDAALVGGIAAVLMAPWLIKNAVCVGNPFSPFLNRWFPNPYVKISFEESYREGFRDYFGAIRSPLEIPREVTVGGAKLNGFLGPAFLLAPMGLLALRHRIGRRVLLGAAVFLLSYPSNIGTRFLITALPFAAFAMGMTLSEWRMGTLIIAAHALFSWPSVASLYCHEHAWRFNEFRYKAALRMQPEDEFLREHSDGYRMARLIEELVPPHGKVLGLSGIPEAYTSREYLVVYQSGQNTVLGDILIAGMSPDYQPSRILRFRFPEREARRVRLVQTASVPDQWSVSEVRIFSATAEVARDAALRLRAHPNPWEVQMAFDGCPVTRWRTWERARPGMFLEVDLGRRVAITEVRLEASPDQRTAVRLEIEGADGRWAPVGGEPEVADRPLTGNARRVAIDDLKRAGITHLAITRDDFLAEDLYKNRLSWGISISGETQFARLYKLD